MLGNVSSIPNGLSVSVDWISFTSTIIQDVNSLINFLGYSPADFVKMPRGAMGYKSMLKLTGFPVILYYDGSEDMGIHCSISGSAIRDVLEHYRETLCDETPFGGVAYAISDFDSTVMFDFLSAVQRIGTLTRLDLCIDDFGCSYFSVDDVIGYIKRGEVVSKFRSWREIYESSFTGQCSGQTLYMGSRSSDIMLRVYDKQAEQNKKLKSQGEQLLDTPWVRWELELHDQYATVASNYITVYKNLGSVITMLLNNYVRFVVLDDSNKSRCSTLDKWESFVSTVSSLRLFVPKCAKTIADKRHWLIKSILPTLSGVIVADGGSLDIIGNHFVDSLIRMSPHMQSLVDAVTPGWRDLYNVA